MIKLYISITSTLLLPTGIVFFHVQSFYMAAFQIPRSTISCTGILQLSRWDVTQVLVPKWPCPMYSFLLTVGCCLWVHPAQVFVLQETMVAKFIMRFFLSRIRKMGRDQLDSNIGTTEAKRANPCSWWSCGSGVLLLSVWNSNQVTCNFNGLCNNFQWSSVLDLSSRLSWAYLDHNSTFPQASITVPGLPQSRSCFPYFYLYSSKTSCSTWSKPNGCVILEPTRI